MQNTREKFQKFISATLSNSDFAKIFEEVLQENGQSLRKIARFDDFPVVDDPDRERGARFGVIIDTETTGVDASKDQIIELAMLKFKYDDEGIIALVDLYDEFNDPGQDIPVDVQKITGITNEMVAGKAIDAQDVANFIDGCDMVIAHNAGFDRKFVERCLPQSGFDSKNWFCSLEQVDWLNRGKSGRSLEVLVLSEGYVYGSHRADADVIATAYVMNSAAADGKTAFSEVLVSGQRDTLTIIAEGSKFEAKDLLKDRGYKWSGDGVETLGIKAWYTSIPDTEEARSEEAEFLRGQIYRKDVSLPMYRESASTRFSARKTKSRESFDTKTPEGMVDHARQRDYDNSLSFDF